ncbi:MAG: peptidylprolyl isomerase, partial [Planctomycetota bacterium]
MFHRFFSCVTLALLAVSCPLSPSASFADETVNVLMKTSEGDVLLELNQTKAPISTENFLKYVEDGYYEGTIFHRVIKSFM